MLADLNHLSWRVFLLLTLKRPLFEGREQHPEGLSANFMIWRFCWKKPEKIKCLMATYVYFVIVLVNPAKTYPSFKVLLYAAS